MPSTSTRRSGWGKGSARSSTASTTEKTAEVRPMPSARVKSPPRTALRAGPGCAARNGDPVSKCPWSASHRHAGEAARCAFPQRSLAYVLIEEGVGPAVLDVLRESRAARQQNAVHQQVLRPGLAHRLDVALV